MTQNKNNSVQSIHRVFQILETLSLHPHGLTLTSISKIVNLSKSTVYRMLSSLNEIGYATKEISTGRYRLTLRMLEVGSNAIHALGILDIATPYLEELLEASKETVHLVVRENEKVAYVYKRCLSSLVDNMRSDIGKCSPMYCTGVGKAIMAYLPTKEVQQIWENSNPVRFTKNTIVDFQTMQKELSEIRKRGYAFDNEEHEIGIFCVAAPIFDYMDKPQYAISIAAPSVRISDIKRQKFAEIVCRAAAEISTMLGNRS